MSKAPPLDDRAKAALTALYNQLKIEMSSADFQAFGVQVKAQITFKRDYSKYRDKPYQYAKEILKVKWLPKQIEIAEAVMKYPRVMVRSSNGYGKCMGASERVTLFDGREVEAKDLIGEYFVITAFDPNSYKLVPGIAYAEDNGAQNVVEIKTQTGRKVIRTENHRLMTWDGWQEVSSLKAGDKIAVPTVMKVRATKAVLTDSQIKFIAYMLGDGGCTGNTLTFSQAPGKQLDEFKQIAGDLGAIVIKSTSNPYAYRLRSTNGEETFSGGRHEMTQFKRLLKDQDIYRKGSADKRIPKSVFGLPNDKIALFLSRYYSTDGWASVGKTTFNSAGVPSQKEIGIASISEEMMRDVQRLLLRFGIQSRVQKRKGHWNDNIYYSYAVVVMGIKNLVKFCENVGIYGKEVAIERVYSACRQQTVSPVTKARDTDLEFQDVKVWDEMKEACEANGIVAKDLNIGSLSHRGVGYAPNLSKIRTVANATQDRGLLKKSSDEIGWDKIVSITRLGEQPTVAIEVKDYHAYFTSVIDHNSYLAGSLINFFFDVRIPSITLTTAPTESSVIDILWKEVRTQRKNRPGLSPKAPRMELAPNHYAQGYTAKDAASFQGRREKDLLIVMDEAIGIPEEFWTAAKAMCTSPEHRWLVLYNPLDSSSFVYTEETNVDSNWHVITLNALEHPNVALELAGHPPLVEAGVRLSWINQAFKDWATKINSTEDVKPIYDVEWPPASGIWYKPGPEFEARVLGRWPTGSVYSIWNDAVITACETKQYELPKDVPPEIGCDVARMGDNFSVNYVRWGKSITHRESRQGVEYAWTASRLRQLADEHGQKAGIEGKKIAVKIDAGGGYGEAVFELREGYNFILINGASTAIRENNYHNRRSELWFQTFRMAEDGLIEWSRLTPEEKKKLRRQLLSAKYAFDNKNRLQVEEKKKTMKEAGGSPDEADALNLACTNFFRLPLVKKKNAVEPFKDRYKDKGFVDQSRQRDWMLT